MLYNAQFEAQLLWIWTFTTYQNEQGEALDEKAFTHLYTAYQQSEPRDEALDVVAWAKKFHHDQVLMPDPVPRPAQFDALIKSVPEWAAAMQQPQQPLQAAPLQLLPLGGTSSDIATIRDLHLRSISPDPPGHVQNPEQQQSASAGQDRHDTLEGSDRSEQPHDPAGHYVGAAFGRTQDAALQAHTVRRNALLDMNRLADMSNQYVPQHTPVRDEYAPCSFVDHTAAPSQGMGLHNAAVGEMMHMRRAKGSCKF